VKMVQSQTPGGSGLRLRNSFPILLQDNHSSGQRLPVLVSNCNVQRAFRCGLRKCSH